MLLHLGLLAVCTWVLPFCMGMLPVRYMKEEHKSFGMVWLSGWMMMFAVFEVLVVPFIVREASFSMAIQCYTVVIGILAVLFLFLGRSTVPACLRKWKEARPDWGQAMIMFLVLTLIILQLIFAFYMQYLDGDDSFFVATSLTSQHTDTMYRFTPYYGANGGLDIRHALSPEPIFMAWLSEVSGIHVTIICHSYISILFLILMYCIYGQVGSQLFPLQRKNRWLFLLFLNIWYLFGNVSIYAAESFAYTRTWQGKAMFPNLMVPLLFLWLLYMQKTRWMWENGRCCSSLFSVRYLLPVPVFLPFRFYCCWQRLLWQSSRNGPFSYYRREPASCPACFSGCCICF